ncbi:putative protein OS=Ureibacillus acetophenoni OX=614649 GN=SAMN05877842_111122 PE=4 SV=1 [Ureibacillus acetophenoni]
MEFTLNEKSPQNFAFEYKKDGENLAEIEWIQKGDVMVMNHTYVSEVLRGQGIAKKLLDKAAEYAREHNYKMEAVCSYVVAAFDGSTAYDDVKA